jgi:hypothetical protein
MHITRKTQNATWYNKHLSTEAMLNSSWKGLFLLVFLPNGNGHSCEMHLFGCGNSLLVNKDNKGVSLCLCLCSFMQNKLACYTINHAGSDGCRVGLTAMEYMARE